MRYRPLCLMLALLWGFAAPGALLAAGVVQGPATPTRSYSGQFVMARSSVASGAWGLAAQAGADGKSLVDLDPMLLPISCERVKQALLQELNARDVWTGKIYLNTRPATRYDPGILITSEQYRNGWRYQLELANPVGRQEYIRAVVQVLLLEMANRNNTGEAAEMPAWLVDGLAQCILSSKEIEIILSPPASGTAVKMAPSFAGGLKTAPMKALHQQLAGARVLSFDEMSWPGPELLTSSRLDVFDPNAHFFVVSLLKLPGGRPAMLRFVESSAANQNWQFSFMNCFSNHFKSSLDVEKWWTLQTSYFLGRGVDNSWTVDESFNRLLSALQVPARVHRSTNELPVSASVSLQTVLNEWDAVQQDAALRRKVRELEMVRLRVATNYVGVVEEYRQVLVTTLERRQTAGLPFGLRKQAAQKSVSREAALRLDELDAYLREIRTNMPTTVAQTQVRK